MIRKWLVSIIKQALAEREADKEAERKSQITKLFSLLGTPIGPDDPDYPHDPASQDEWPMTS